MKLALPTPLFNAGCEFVGSFLTSTAWHSFFRLDTTFSQEETGMLGIFEQVKYTFLTFLWKYSGSQELLSLTVLKLGNLGVEINALSALHRSLKVSKTSFMVHVDIFLLFFTYFWWQLFSGVFAWGIFRYGYQDLIQVILHMMSSSCIS